MILGKQPRFNIDPESFFCKRCLCVCVRVYPGLLVLPRAKTNNDNGKTIIWRWPIYKKYIFIQYVPFPMFVYQRVRYFHCLFLFLIISSNFSTKPVPTEDPPTDVDAFSGSNRTNSRPQLHPTPSTPSVGNAPPTAPGSGILAFWVDIYSWGKV